MGKLFSPGKLLITSEYVVLDGALALAVPTQFGQEFFFEEMTDGKALVFWDADHENKPWLKAVINYQTQEVVESNLETPANFVLQIFKNLRHLNSDKLKGLNSYRIRTNLQFPPDYGLGSSSTLMNNIANWAGVDPFELNTLSLGGSGYDIAVAREISAILYQNAPERFIEKINFNPRFKEDLIFIHLNQKQDSRAGIAHYRSSSVNPSLIDHFTAITKQVLEAKTLEEFSDLMTEHEEELSTLLQLPTIKKERFQDYGGFVKSLGAWGGDFVMASKFGDFTKYFASHNLFTIYDWDELIS